jgi:DNA-binding LacI/PurR family transcriptional regulator
VATLADVARVAGVSPSTVSYVLTGNRPISAATRERIEQAMQELGYTPNPFARGLKAKSAKIIAMSCPIAGTGMPGLTLLEYVMSASQRAQERGYHLLLWTTPTDTVDGLAQLAGQGLVDGVVVMEVRMHDPRIKVLTDARLPFVLIGRNADPAGLDFIDTDFDQCAALAINHLVELGHRRLGVVTDLSSRAAGGRGASVRFMAAVRRAASQVGARLTTVRCEPSPDAGRRTFRALVAKDPQITAVLVANIDTTSGIMAGAFDAGLRISEDLSVMGLIMAPNQAQLTVPALTAVSPPISEMGRSAVDQLINRIEGNSSDIGQWLFQGELELRETTGPARHGRGAHVTIGAPRSTARLR